MLFLISLQAWITFLYELIHIRLFSLEGMGVSIQLFHTGRRTTVGQKICDALSKGEFKEVRQEMPDGKDISNRSSKVLLRWIINSVVTMSLGRWYWTVQLSKC